MPSSPASSCSGSCDEDAAAALRRGDDGAAAADANVSSGAAADDDGAAAAERPASSRGAVRPDEEAQQSSGHAGGGDPPSRSASPATSPPRTPPEQQQQAAEGEESEQQQAAEEQPEQQQPTQQQQQQQHHAAAAASAADAEPEPQLKYERLGGDVKPILARAAATALALSDKVLALGTAAGDVHVLDHAGNEVKRLKHHEAPVRALSFDAGAEFLASACGGGYATVADLYSGAAAKFAFKRPITAVALDPRYGARRTREFATGDVRGRVKLSSQGWLGRGDAALHAGGEGAVQAMAWQGLTLAWATEASVRVRCGRRRHAVACCCLLGRPWISARRWWRLVGLPTLLL